MRDPDALYCESRWRDARRAIHDRAGKSTESINATWLALRLGLIVLAVIAACVAIGAVATWRGWNEQPKQEATP